MYDLDATNTTLGNVDALEVRESLRHPLEHCLLLLELPPRPQHLFKSTLWYF